MTRFSLRHHGGNTRRTLCALLPLLAASALPACAPSQEPPDPGAGGPVGEASEAVNAACAAGVCTSASVNLNIVRPNPAATPAAVFDTQLNQGTPGTPDSPTNQSMATGTHAGNVRYSLLTFDLSALSPAGLAALNASAVNVNGAYITLTLGGIAPSGAGTVNVHQITSTWSQATATWNSPPTWNAAVAQSFNIAAGATAGTVLPVVNVFSLVQAWTSGTPNDGVLLEEPGANAANFFTSEYGVLNERPALTVVYTLTCVSGYADCDNNGADGCEVQIATDVNNCGGCGDVCPAGDMCQNGACVTPCAGVVCTPLDACHVAGTCNPANGQCSNPPAANGTACAGGTCTAGACVAAASCPCDGNVAWTRALSQAPRSCAQPDPGDAELNLPAVQGGAYALETLLSTPTCLAADLENDQVILTGSVADIAVCVAEVQAACACPTGTGFCGGACIDTATDPNNCGACGDVCAAGTSCNAGTCGPPPPTLLASGQPFPSPVAIDATTVYWGNLGDHTVRSVPKSGGAITTLATAAGGPYGIAVTSSALFFTEDTQVETVAKAGGATTVFALVQPASRGIAADATNVYWANYFGNDVVVCAESGGCSQSPAVFGTSQNPVSVALDSTNVYWVDQGDGALYQCPKTGCPGGTPIHIGAGGYAGIATDGANVYFAGQSTVWQVPIGGGAPLTLVTGLGLVQGLATDGVSVYYADTHGAVGKCAVGGCGNTPTLIATGLDNPQQVVVDTTSVYFADTNNGNVWKAPK